MRKVIRHLVTLVLITGSLRLSAQDYSNKGKDFWVIYTGHIDGTSSRMALYITSEFNASGTLSVGGSSLPFTVTANQITTLRLTNASTPNNSLAYNGQVTGIGTNKGIHIVADTPIVVYAHLLNAARSGSTLVLPTKVLGREYFVSTYASTPGANSKPEFAIVATEDNTQVEIKATLADANNTYPANIPFQVTLNKGDVFQYQAANGTDLSGSYIKSVASASAPCKPIAVFAGSTWTAMGCASAGSGDNLYQELFPLVSWGQSYITAPFKLRAYDIFRIMVKDPTTVVQVNGVTLNPGTLINNSFYEINTIGNNTPRIITSDKPVCVVQYMITQNCDGVNSDPEMIILNPIEQTLNDITVLSARNNLTPPNTNITRHFLNIIIKTAGLSSLRIDGAPYTSTPVAIPSTPYSYLQEEITASTASNPTHRAVSDSGFTAIAYGYGNVESYGYNAGTNVRDLYQFVTVQNQYATVPFPAACKSSPFYFSMVFPYQPTQIAWNFNGLFTNVTIANPVYDSTWTVNGKQLYRYKLATPYTINTAGTYPIRVIAQNPTPDGCSGEQQIDYDLQVFNPPLADFSYAPVCFPSPVQFAENNNTGGRPVISRYWDFGDAVTANNSNPLHSYAAPGIYNARFALITDVGCLSDTTIHPVTVSPLPTASISGSIQVCQNGTPPQVSFTGATGTAPYLFTYSINGGAPLTVTSTGNTATVAAPTTSPGIFTYTLISVKDASPAACSQAQTGTATVTVNPLPTAGISGNTAVCQHAASPFISFTGATGTAPYTFTYNINGGASQSVTTTTGNSVTVAVPTSTVGTFVYNLLNVTDGTSTACSQNQAGAATVTVNPLPTASVSGTTEICQNGTAPVISFTGAAGTAPYTFFYRINGGPLLSVTATGNTATVSAPTTTAGTFVYTLVSVTDGSSTACNQLQTGSAAVTVHPLPTGNFNFSTPQCPGIVLNFTDNSVPNVGSLVSWNWNFNDPSSGALNTSVLQHPSHLFYTAGIYNVTLTVSNDKGCVSNPYTSPVIIRPKPLSGFILPDVCLNDTYAQFADTSSVDAPGSITAWQWNFGDPGSGANNGSVLQNPQHSYTAVGSYPVELIVTSNYGCRDTVQQQLYVNGSFPVANFTVNNPAALCANDSVAIVEASSVFPGNITKVEVYWDNAGQPTVFDVDDVPYTGKVYKHLYPNFQSPLTKTFIIRYRAYSGGVCVNEISRNITVNAAPLVQFTTLPDVCLDAAPFQITQATETGGVPGSFMYSGPGVSASGIFDPAAAGPGTHTIKYVFTSSAGGCADSITQTIKVFAPAVAAFSSVSPLCETKTLSFPQSSTTPEGILVSWTWDFGDGSPLLNVSSGNPVTHIYAAWGDYTVKLKVMTSNGCVSTDAINNIHVNPQPGPDFSIPASVCLPNGNAQFTNLSVIADATENSFTYRWDFGDPASGVVNTSTAINPSHTYVTTGPYAVNLQVTSGAGCVDDTTISITTIHDQPLASFNTDKPAVCLGDAIQFTDNTNPMGGITSQWNWTMDDGATRNTAGFAYTYADSGTYRISLFTVNSFGCRSTTFTAPVTIHSYPVVDAGPDRRVLEGGQIVLQPTVSGNDLSYNWTPNRYFISSNTVLNPIILGAEDITYTLVVTGRGGCMESDQVFIKVLKKPMVPNIFSPNGDGIHDKWEILYLESYPGCTIDVVNRYGQPVFHSAGYTYPWDGKINGKDAPVGTYYYVIDPKNGRARISGYVDIIR
ncbi:MAG: PKD domain-containing protein [Sphingobacteriales bacterium]|nr:PKD domain-containing protein [Sphingobacteriales bacterium]